MTEGARKRLSAALSVALHSLLVFWGFWNLRIAVEAPELDIEWEEVELIDPDQIQGAVKEPEPEPEPEPEVKPEEPPPLEPPPAEKPKDPEPKAPEEPGETAPKQQDEPAIPKPPKSFAGKVSRADQLGPTSSTFYVLLANKRIRGLSLAEPTIELLAPHYDFRFIVHGGGFHPLEDFDYIVMASADLRDVTQTFLAMQYRVSQDEMKRGFERAAKGEKMIVEWETRDGVLMANPRPQDVTADDWDPRFFAFIGENTAVYVRPEFIPEIIAGGGAGKTAKNFVANVSNLERFAKDEPRAGMQLVVRDLRASIKKVRTKSGGKLPFEFFDGIEMMAEAAEKPELVVKLTFIEEAHAQDFVKFWEETIGDEVRSNITLQLAGASAIYKATKVSQDGLVVTLRHRFGSEQATVILELLADSARKMLSRSDEEMEKMAQERQRMWEARGRGELTPSQARGEETQPAVLSPDGASTGEEGAAAMAGELRTANDVGGQALPVDELPAPRVEGALPTTAPPSTDDAVTVSPTRPPI